MRNHIAAASLLMLLMTAFAVVASAQGAKATDVKVSMPAGLLDYRGRCPVDIPITGSIQATGLGLIKYQFVHSSGASGPVQRLISIGSRQYEVRESPARNMGAEAPDWNDTVTLRILSGSGSPFDSAPIKYVGTCGRATVAPKTATLSPYFGPAQGTFRVTINGFTCNSATSDTSIFGDGAGDEIYMYTKTFNVEVRPDGGQNTRSGFVQSFTYGDISNDPSGQRIRAGSSRFIGSNGGIVAGDSYPSSPEKRSTNPQFQTLPEQVWQGTIARFQNGVIIVPMIWESDGLTRYLGDYQNLVLNDAAFTFLRSIKDPRRHDETELGFAIRAEFDRIAPLDHPLSFYGLSPQYIADAPIGEREASGFRFKAQALFLTYDEALRMSENLRTTGKAFPITYVSDPGASGGSYTIWIQVEQLP